MNSDNRNWSNYNGVLVRRVNLTRLLNYK